MCTVHLLESAADIRTVQELLHVATTMIYTHVLNHGGLGVQSPADLLGEEVPARFPELAAGHNIGAGGPAGWVGPIWNSSRTAWRQWPCRSMVVVRLRSLRADRRGSHEQDRAS